MPPLLDRFPELARRLPRVDLRVIRTPIERWQVEGTQLWAKRDDLSAPLLGGNKVRALELLLAGLGPDDTVLTVGATGSTHALSVARYAGRLGARTEVITWPQEAQPIAKATARAIAGLASVTHARSVLDAYLRATLRRLARRYRWIPAGGSVPLGALGHVNAALELADQVRAGELPEPAVVVVPLGTGGTAAGLLVGFAIAGLRSRVVGVRVVPRVVANRQRVLGLARRTRRLVGRLADEVAAPLDVSRFVIDDDAYGGAYARETAAARDAAAALLASGGPALEGTYSAKAFGAALALARRVPEDPVLFWLTFDARWLTTDDAATMSPPIHSKPASL